MRTLLVPVAAAAMLFVAGCTGAPSPNATSTPTPTTNGVEAMEPDAILDAAEKALTDAESVHVSGTIGEGAEAITLGLTYAGANAIGTIEVSGVAADVRKLGTDVYVKAADTSLYAQFLSQEQQALLPLIADKWVKVNAGLAAMFIPGAPLSVEQFTVHTPPLEKGDVTEVGGTPAITVTDADGQSYAVAIVGKPYILESTYQGSTLTFSDYDKPVTIEAPAAADVVDVLALLGGLG
ncbi:MAG: hypothetical protein IRY85_11735 [Micromonosporaceae bacterium]|nr:hypothetical protein [Micromonosporaceae bacterium]